MTDGKPVLKPFSRSHEVYGLVYAAKPYAREAAFVHRLIRKRAPRARSLLELGCGPGLHSRAFAGLGYEVTGLDRSAAMLKAAAPAAGVTLRRADARNARLGRRFDAVVALFHVFSYLTERRELAAALATAAAHLREGGVLVFDCWNRDGVLASPPRPRVVKAEDRTRRVERRSMAELSRGGRLADVRQVYTVWDKASGKRSRFTERHRMRAWTAAELRSALEDAGFSRVECFEWLTRRAPGAGSWSLCAAAQKV